ncbi:MAG: SufD family Fe-S cluster assembly protein [Candidatus Aenigmarchaeota archaeon]|nr:SufD family Fe-S cluster assembly protein [Candidatus Aenigmarchaeota archaeon]MDW8160099.1 SufD family Fe-S cluster assembly protein [Candidatus Aenigmarchaeota archaeon]
MDMRSVKSVENVNYYQVDNEVRRIFSLEGVEVLSIVDAWEKYDWVREYFEKKPIGGYFVWVKKQIDAPISTCVGIASKKIDQNLCNLLVVEKNIKVKGSVFCFAFRKNLNSKHSVKGKILLKENSSIDYAHFHAFGFSDSVFMDYEFFLEKGSKLEYIYKNMGAPVFLERKMNFLIGENASVTNKSIIVGTKSNVKIFDSAFLNGRNSSVIMKLRLVGREKSTFDSSTQIFGKEESKGHLDCQGLIVDSFSKISLTPKLVVENKKSILTHEASIGRINEEQLNYLRARGLSEKEAINLIVNGFISID